MKYIPILLILLLVGCATDPEHSNRILPDTRPSTTPEMGTVVIGFGRSNPRRFLRLPMLLRAAWIQYDPTTNRRVGAVNAVMEYKCGFWHECETYADYQIFTLPAGSYALGWVLHEKAYPISKFMYLQSMYYRGQVVDVGGSEAAEVPPGVPRFTVLAGQILYVGDLFLRFTDDGQLSFQEQRADNGARQALGPEFANQMIVGGWANPGTAP